MLVHVMPQSHPTMGPIQFLSPVRFLARKAEWSARRNFTLVLFPWSHQATGPVWLDTSAYLWFGWIIRRTPQVPCAPAQESLMFFISYGARAWPARVLYGALTDMWGNWHNHNWQKSRTGLIYGCTGPLRSPHGLFTGCLQSQNPYRARKLIMHALKLYRPHTGGKIRTASHGAGPVSGCMIFVQNSPGTARAGPGSVMWLRH